MCIGRPTTADPPRSAWARNAGPRSTVTVVTMNAATAATSSARVSRA